MENKLNKSLKFLPEFLKSAIEKELKIVIDEEFELAKKRIDERKSTIVSGVVLYVMGQIQIDTIGEKITIVVKEEN